MVDTLASDGRSSLLGVSCLVSSGMVLEATKLRSYSLLGVLVVLVSELLMLGGDHVVDMLLRQSFLVVDWLDRGVVMVLVDLSVDSLSNVLMACWVNSFLCHCWVDDLVDGGLVASVASELLDGGFSLLHDEY